jgi:lipoate-protein ligase B
MMTRKLTVYQINRMPYAEAVDFQRHCVEQLRQSGADEGVLILLEHPPVITIGRSGTDKNIIAPLQLLEKEGVDVYESSRGGDVTYHGPGQLVGYPILPLKFHGKDIHRYLRTMEELLMAAIGEYDIPCHRREGLTGVWTDRGKMVSIGVAVRHWISYHGFALNVAPNMAHFNLINPCGLKDVTMVGMKDFLGDAPPRAEVEEHVLDHFREAFGFDQMTTHNVVPAWESDS